MATTKQTDRRRARAGMPRLVRRYQAVITAGVEGIALLLRLPLVVHLLVTVATRLAIVLLTGGQQRR